ncbi:MAG TPA: DUF4157 domain-containing protein [Flavipsychrobacter sp.]|nr:DUF4157 domain-containing protein [Flavipsychrobacter sp.]
MKSVRIKENAWIAKIAAKKLGVAQLAIVIGRTIFLHNVSEIQFLSNKRWLMHELKHVAQYEEHGMIGFLCKYIFESIKSGYRQNKYEVAARKAETDESLLTRYKVLMK